MKIEQIPEELNNKVRLSIHASLFTGEKTFTELKELTGATDGNLSTQLTKLEKYKSISEKKEFIGKKPCTKYNITEKGLANFKNYIELLENVIKSSELK